jgi:hypothetical protein
MKSPNSHAARERISHAIWLLYTATAATSGPSCQLTLWQRFNHVFNI